MLHPLDLECGSERTAQRALAESQRSLALNSAPLALPQTLELAKCVRALTENKELFFSDPQLANAGREFSASTPDRLEPDAIEVRLSHRPRIGAP